MNAASRSHVVGFIASLLALLLSLSTALASEKTLPARDWKTIRRVIADQRVALAAGDAEKAFAFAAPAIRDRLGDASTFLAMVRDGYEAIVTARDVEFLEGAVIDDIVVQPLRLIGTDNIVRVALYTMERQANGAWRISGCRIAPSTLQVT